MSTLTSQGLISSSTSTPPHCWSPALSTVDSAFLVVVDALRFDFASTRLPKLMTRYPPAPGSSSSSTKLYKFVADPPTVTTQRLKGLTTGGLPTFSEITKSFSAGVLTEDNLIDQIHKKSKKSFMSFVGDDTWSGLFPTQFDEAHPYPSFNTRDLNTVDDGCLLHLPSMLRHNHTDLLVAHFLGVDHVGHTYGPNGVEMVEKLKQMDDVLVDILDVVEQNEHGCSVAFVFGDHGMTEGGNHGGGSDDEVTAALFVHYSPGCNLPTSGTVNGEEIGDVGNSAFEFVNQIDLVPTISLLLGVPIPFQNLGSVIPELLPLHKQSETTHAQQVAIALGLNAAQVSRYLNAYKKIASLPAKELEKMENLLSEAVVKFEEALDGDGGGGGGDSMAYREACALFKVYLAGVTDLGRKVWTNFNFLLMSAGLVCILLSLFPLGWLIVWGGGKVGLDEFVAGGLVTFHAILLITSNSYIEKESEFCQLGLVIISGCLLRRKGKGKGNGGLSNNPLVIPLLSMLHKLLVDGHGQDVALHRYGSHDPKIFSVFILAMIYMKSKLEQRKEVFLLDVLALLSLGASWLQKYVGEKGHNLALLSMAISIFCLLRKRTSCGNRATNLLVVVMALTGPSSAPSALMMILQMRAIATCGGSTLVIASLFRLATRQIFFITGHACSFNQLQYSAAFVWRDDFTWWSGALSLGLNTFGWELVSTLMIWGFVLEKKRERGGVGMEVVECYGWITLLEVAGSCICVTIQCRHLMLWAVFAPRFCFSVIFSFYQWVPIVLMVFVKERGEGGKGDHKLK